MWRGGETFVPGHLCPRWEPGSGERSSPATSFVRLFKPPSVDCRDFCSSGMNFQVRWPGPHFRYAHGLFFNTCVQLLFRGFSSVCFLELDIGLCKGEMACHLQFPLQIFRKGKMEWNLDILESG